MLKSRVAVAANLVLDSSPKAPQRLLLVLALAGLTACGGGGGGGGGGDSQPAPQSGYTVSGRIIVPESTLVDSDVNDPNATHASNNSIATAQALPNPARVGGYANVPGAGADGRLKAAGDEVDAFRINATAGQTVTLFVGDPSVGDLDLYLYSTSGQVIARSVGTGKDESVTIPATGSYIVSVEAYQGASAYVLTLGQSTTATTTDNLQLRSSDEFVPGDIIVQWKPGAQARAGSSSLSAAASTLRAHGMSMAVESGVGPSLLKLEPASSALAEAKNPGIRALAQDSSEPFALKAATLERIKQLRADPNVASADLNYVRRPLFTPNDPLYRLQWHYPLISLPAAWDITQGSNSVIVAVLDTGVLLDHPDLRGQLVPGFDFVSNQVNAGDGGGIDNNPADPGRDNEDGTSSFHGTHVAGTIAAASNNGIGVAGVAPNARIMPVRVLGQTGASFDVLQGVLFAAGLPNSSNTLPARRADIINMSLGGTGSSQVEQDVYNQVRAAGVIVVAAAGNDGRVAAPPLEYPAAYDNVISVSAVNLSRTRAYYSTFNSRVDVAAPGGDIRSDTNGDGAPDAIVSTFGDDRGGTSTTIAFNYAPNQGTSMAAPHMAGVLALMKSVRPSLTPVEVDALLASGRLTNDLGTPGRDDQYGHGLIDALKAVQAAQGNTDLPGTLVATPPAINLAPNVSSQTFTLSNGGTRALPVPSVAVTPANGWLAVTPPTSADGLGTYTLRVNRAGLAPGAYSGSIRLTSGTAVSTISVVMQVTATGVNPNSDLGHHYILLIDQDGKAVQQSEARISGGVYNFQLAGVPAGEYLLVAGSDADNSGSIGDWGEAAGAYRSMSDPVALKVTGNVTGLEFDSGFMFALTSAQSNSLGASGLSDPLGPLGAGQRKLAKRLR